MFCKNALLKKILMLFLVFVGSRAVYSVNNISRIVLSAHSIMIGITNKRNKISNLIISNYKET